MFDIKIDFQAAADQLKIILLWDQLPDHCKTQGLLEQIKGMETALILNQLKPTNNNRIITNN